MKTVIFDMDGTLIDSMMVWDKVCQDYLVEREITYAGDIGREVKNMSFQESAQYYIEKFGLKETSEQIIDEWKTMARRAYADTITIKKGVHRVLDELEFRGIKMALATSTDRDLVEIVLGRLEILKYFKMIITVQEMGIGKENPDFFLDAAEKLGVKPDECLVFDDCLHAVNGAKKAGMKVWAVYDECSAYERPELERIADRYIESFEEVDFTGTEKVKTGLD